MNTKVVIVTVIAISLLLLYYNQHKIQAYLNVK